MYIGDTLARRAIYTPEALAVVDASKQPNRRYTYAQLNDRANRFANWLKQAGIKRGDHVGIIAHNGVEFLDVFFACGKLGAVFVCYDWQLNIQQLTEMVNRTNPKVMIFSDDFADTIAHILFETKSIQALLNIEGYSVNEKHHFEDVLTNASPSPISTEDFTENDIAYVIFTTAESEMAEPIPLSYRVIAWNVLTTIINYGLRTDDVVMNSFPLFHMGGLLANALPSLILGGSILLAPESDPENVLELLEHHRVTILAGLPDLFERLPKANRWKAVSLKSLRFCTSGGTPLSAELVHQFEEDKDIGFYQGFGMSAFGTGIFTISEEDAIRKAGSIGRPSFFVDAKIVDDRNNPLPEGVIGELVIKAPSVPRDARATESKIDKYGWLHTGDLARYDKEWFFYIVEHQSNFFKSEKSASAKTD